MVGPIVEELSKEYDGKAVIGKVNVDHNPNISMNFGIRNIPTLLIFKNGQVVDKQVGGSEINSCRKIKCTIVLIILNLRIAESESLIKSLIV